ncbi:MAG: hypothetical protein OER95_20110, partial [Acidimicrobiia bacterium]|nr:hypothetical protein [Acidimicrobiia bacterium]
MEAGTASDGLRPGAVDASSGHPDLESCPVAGTDPGRASPAERASIRRSTVSFILQTSDLLPAPTAYENVLRVLEEQARAGMTVLIVTHNREISRIADRVIELSSGHIVADGPPAGGRARTDD